MAKFIKEYELHLFDKVKFRLPYALPGNPNNFKEILGIVQDISEFPDVCVEVGIPGCKEYNRYRISVNMITQVLCKDDDWITEYTKFDNKEAVEFVYENDLKTPKVIRYV